MSNSNDPFLVTSRLGITSVLRDLMTQKALLHLRLDKHGPTIITTVLAVDTDGGKLVVDAADDTFNQRLQQARELHCDAQLNRIRIQFSTGRAQALTFEQRPAFWLPYPESLLRLQRRRHFRIDIPASTPLFCELPVKEGQPLTLAVKDISAGGIALFDPDQKISGTPGDRLRQCVLELDGIGTVVIDLAIRRISTQVMGNTQGSQIIACEFDALPPQEGIMIQNFIGGLDRLLNARRRGFD